MDDKQLQIYQLLYQAYADEIKNLWQRSIFLASFMVLVWTGYGVSLLKFLETTKEIKLCQNTCTNTECLKSSCELLVGSINTYHLILLALCGIIIILSLLWIAMAKASKFVQEAHEEHIKSFEFNDAKIKQLFCDLDVYEPILENKNKLSAKSPLKAYRYSPSRINIALGWVSLLASFTLLNIHTLWFRGVKLENIKECFVQIMQKCFLLITQLVKYLQCLSELLCVFVLTLSILLALYFFLYCILKSKGTK